ncbi:MAG: DUF6265 family protein [Chitinophagaceae bacterium]
MKQAQHFISKLITLFSLILMITGCNNAVVKTQEETATKTNEATPPAQTTIFDQLIGTWLQDDGKSYEQWKKNDNGTYKYVAFTIKGTDTSWNELANVYPEKNQWVFENTVKGQNNGRAVKFTSIFSTEKSIQFSNPAHDFPTDINYTLRDENTINAFIVGPNSKGGKDTILFNSKRVL